jgi:hypothetical protein
MTHNYSASAALSGSLGSVRSNRELRARHKNRKEHKSLLPSRRLLPSNILKAAKKKAKLLQQEEEGTKIEPKRSGSSSKIMSFNT